MRYSAFSFFLAIGIFFGSSGAAYSQQAQPAPRPAVQVAPLDGGAPLQQTRMRPAPRRAERALIAIPRAIVGNLELEQAESLLSAPLPVAAPPLVVDRETCASAMAGDVAYKAGIDVHGRAVVPADDSGLEGFLINTDLLFDSRRPDGTAVRGESLVGRVVVDGQGRAFLNGRLLTGGGGRDLRALCHQVGLRTGP